MGSSSPKIGMNIKKIFDLPPTRHTWTWIIATRRLLCLVAVSFRSPPTCFFLGKLPPTCCESWYICKESINLCTSFLTEVKGGKNFNEKKNNSRGLSLSGWWLKSCTTWDVWNPINNGIFTISTGAGFQPSTVWCGDRPSSKKQPQQMHEEHVKWWLWSQL